MDDQHSRALAFRALHDRDAPPLRLLNAWDAGSAKALVAVRAAGIPAFVNAAAQELLGTPGTYGDGGGLSYAEVNDIMNGS